MSDTDINVTVNVTEDIYPDVDSTAVSAAVIDDGDSIVVPAEVDFGDTFDAELEDENLIDVPVDESVGVQGDHRVLLHRDAANQHPMSAITGLGDALDAINTELSSRIGQVEAESAELEVDMASALLRIGDLQDQVDGNITTWFYAAEPAMNLPPVAYDPSNPHDTGWDTPEKKNAHKGDLYYNTLTGYAYRFAYADGDYGWMRITDTDVVKALADAARAQDTADSKRRVFYSTPYPPYDKGDLWVQGSSGDILVCTTSKPADGSYSESDWSSASKYTDDYVANIALASANSKNTVYHQPSQPTGGTYKKGDTWFDSDDDYTMYTYDGALWIKEQFGNEAIADASITNAKIQDATIEYAKIKSVDAGKITVGDISADRMKVNSISAINGNTGTVKINANKVDITGTAVFNAVSGDASASEAMLNSNVQVGGRNLFKNTEVSTSSSSGVIGGSASRAVLEGSEVTISVMVDADNVVWDTTSSYHRVGCEMVLPKSGGGNQYVGVWAGKEVLEESSNIVFAFTGSFHGRVSKTFTLLADIPVDHNCRLYVQGVASGTVTVSNIKLELGNKATDWTPAPEDVQAEIDAKKSVHTLMSSNTSGASYATILGYCAEGHYEGWNVISTSGVKSGDTVRIGYYVSDMNNAVVYIIGTVVSVSSPTYLAMTSHGLDTTVIDGGNILTNSVGANQIAANSITADKIAANTISVGKLDSTTQGYIQKGVDAKTELTVKDTRNDNQSPKWYIDTYASTQREVREFKYANKIGCGSSAYFGYLTTKIPWSDSSGGYPKQSFEMGGRLYVRQGSSDTTWSVWKDVAGIADTYITQIDASGIFISPSDQSPTSSAAGNSARLNGSGLEVFTGGTSVASFGSTARIGVSDGKRVEVKSDGVYVYSGTTQYGYFGSFARIGDYNSNNVRMDSSGVKINTSKDNVVASFGSTITIGASSSSNISIDSSAIRLKVGTGTVGSFQYMANQGYLQLLGSQTYSMMLSPSEIQFNDSSSTSSLAKGEFSGRSLYLGGTSSNNTSGVYLYAAGTNQLNIYASDRTSFTGGITLNNGKLLRLNNGAGSSYDWVQIYSATASNTSNMYLSADGYLAFYVGNASNAPTGRTYIEYDQATFYQKIHAAVGINLPNNQALRGLNTSGTPKSLIYISGTNTVNLGNADGATYVNGTSFSGSKSYTGSDLRLKHDIVPLDDRSSELIMSLKPFEYKWNEGQEHFYSKGKCFGLGAQEVSKLMEDVGYNPKDYRVVEETPDGYLAICYTELIPHLIYTVQKQQKEIEELKGVVKCISF